MKNFIQLFISTLIISMSYSYGITQTSFSLSPNGTSHIYPIVSNPSAWNTTNGYTAGQGDHLGDDYYADDWNANTGGNTDCNISILAAISGTVIYVKEFCPLTNQQWCGNGYGNNVVIQSDVNSTFILKYSHFNSVSVEEGDYVNIGDVIGTNGNTGNSNYCHVHLILYKNITATNIANLRNNSAPTPDYSGGPTSKAAPFYCDATSSGTTEPCNNFTNVTASPSSNSATLSINGINSDATDIAYRYGSSDWLFTNNSTISLSNLAAGTQYSYYVAVYCSAEGWNVSSQQTFTTTAGSGGGTSNGCGGTQYPSSVLYPSNSWQYEDCMYAGEYSKFYVTSGQTYSFSTCNSHGASASYDTELSLINNSGTVLSYDDDYCGIQSKITWTSNFDGHIKVLVTQYSCNTNSTCTKVGYKKGSANFKGGDNDNRSTSKYQVQKVNSINNVSATERSANIISTEIGELDTGIQAQLYPNPSTNVINLDLGIVDSNKESALLQVFNSQGLLIKEFKESIDGNKVFKTIDVSEVTSGFYFMKITVGKQTITERFVISR